VAFLCLVEGLVAVNDVLECAMGTGSAGVLAICIATDAKTKSEL